MIIERNVHRDDGTVIAAVDSGSGSGRLPVLWHAGSPHTGALLPPIAAAAAARGVRLLSYARPAYGASTPRPGRDVASAADDAALVADAFGVGRFAVAGYSGGGPHALACAALLPDRVAAVATLAGIGPYTDEFDWFAGMASPGALRAARKGRAARARYAETEEFDEASFVEADWAALAGDWAALGADAQRAERAGPGGLIDDDVAFAGPWNVDPAIIRQPVLMVQGGLDRIVPPAHTEHLLRRLPHGELWLRPRDGHVSVLAAVPVALDWLAASAGSAG